MLVNQQNVVYEFKCDLFDANYIDSTYHHLHQRVEEHKHSLIGKNFLEKHKNGNSLDNIIVRVSSPS